MMAICCVIPRPREMLVKVLVQPWGRFWVSLVEGRGPGAADPGRVGIDILRVGLAPSDICANRKAVWSLGGRFWRRSGMGVWPI